MHAAPASLPVLLVRCGGIVLIAVVTWRYVRLPLDGSINETFLHLPNLVFHEAGHMLLLPFGRFLSVLGGSLLQVVVPVVCAVALWRRDDWYGAAVCIWWCGESLLDVAPYIADARRLQMPLLGGVTGAEVEGHDWEYLLTALGWLQYDTALGRTAHVVGSAIMFGAIAWASWTTLVEWRSSADAA